MSGSIAGLFRYPVKSMAAEPLDQVALHWVGLDGDRQYAFVRQDDGSDFPWLTGRQVPEMVQYQAHYADPATPKRPGLIVTRPDGTSHDVRDPALAAQLADIAGEPIALLRMGRGAFDAMPVSVMTTATLRTVAKACGVAPDPLRFRPNILLDSDADEAGWLGRILLLGDEGAALRIDLPIPRCAMVGIDPTTAARNPAAVRTVVQRFANQVGVYATVHAPGPVRRGARARLMPA